MGGGTAAGGGTASGGGSSGASPTLTAVSPTSGVGSGTATLVLTGTNLVSGSTVTVGGVACAVTIASGTQLTCTVPASSAIATVPVAVVNGGGSASLSPGFTWVGLPVAWFDAVNGQVTFAGSTVTGWRDRSTFGNDVLACPGQAPDYDPQGLSFRPALHFPNDGTDCRCLTNSSANGMPSMTQARTLISVASVDGTTQSGDIFSFGDAPAINDVRMGLFTSGADFGVDTEGAALLTTAGLLIVNQPYALTYRYAAGTTLGSGTNELRLNGAPVTMTTGGATAPDNTGSYLDIGRPPGAPACTGYHAGYISEILLYDRMLTGVEASVIEAYLKKKYAL
jgi:hypothetical protein